MTNIDTSGSHLVSISHDPMEEDRRPRSRDWADRAPAHDDSLGRRMGQAWDSGRQSLERGTRRVQEAIPEHPMRPLLLAGAIGLLAAWVVSGMGSDAGERQRRHRLRRFRTRHQGSTGRDLDYAPRRPAAGNARRNDTPPEGTSSPHDFAMDALNP